MISFTERLLPKQFKADLCDPEFPLQERFAQHGITRFVAGLAGDQNHLQPLERTSGIWGEVTRDPPPGTPAVALLTPRSVTVDIRELPSVPGGNTESNIARAIAVRPGTILRDMYDSDRSFHAVPLEGRRAIVFSVKAADVHKCLAQMAAQKLKVVHAFCGLAVATKWSLADQLARHADADVLLVNDQSAVLAMSVVNGRIEPLVSVINLSDGDAALEDLKKILRKTTKTIADAGQRPSVVVYTTARGSLTSAATLVEEGCDASLVKIPTAALCFA